MSGAIPLYKLKVHAVALSNDDGSKASDIDAAFLAELIRKANLRFTATHIEFEFDAVTDLETRADTALNALTNSGPRWWKVGNEAASHYPGKVVLFLRHGPGSSPTGNGHAYPPRNGNVPPSAPLPAEDVNYVALPNTRVLANQGDGDFISHELGHYLGLFHTFPGWGNSTVYGPDADTAPPGELLARLVRYTRQNGGSEGALDGDLLSDTTPDPGTRFYRAIGLDPCTSRPVLTIQGQLDNEEYCYTFQPPTNNVMSYHGCDRPKTFMPEQIARMRATLKHPSRPYLIDPPCLSDFHGKEAGLFQTCFDYWIHRGRWPIALCASEVAGRRYMSGSFQRGANRPVRHLITSAAYQKAFEEFRAKGFRPARVTGLDSSVGLRFTAIWAPIDGQFEARHGLTIPEFDGMWHDLRSQGYLHTDMHVYPRSGDMRVAAVWVKKPFVDYATWYGLTRTQFQARSTELRRQGFRETTFCACPVGGGYRYAAIWEKVPGTWSLAYDLSSTEYQQTYDQHAANGFRLHQVQAYGSRYAAIWTKD